MRTLLAALGIVFVALGVVGIFVPFLPTFDFLLLASLCFAKSSPRLERWLLGHPRLGPPLVAWREDRSISRKHKVYACIMLALCVAAAAFFTSVSVWLKLAFAAFAALLMAFILTRKTRLPMEKCPLRPEVRMPKEA